MAYTNSYTDPGIPPGLPTPPETIARLWAEADAKILKERRALRLHVKQSRLVLKDLLLENGFSTDMWNLCKVLRLFVGHPQETVAKQLVDRVEKPRRDEFLRKLAAVIAADALPTEDQIEFGPLSVMWSTQQSLRSEQVRWRREYLTALGWSIRSGCWLPPGVDKPRRKRLRRRPFYYNPWEESTFQP